MGEHALIVVLAAAALVVVIYVVTRLWFWHSAFLVGGLASLFAMLASIIHFHILAAIGFLFVTCICWWAVQFITALIVDREHKSSDENGT
jgi:hypothetical protein